MAGENPDDARSGAPDEFLSKTKWQRFQVLVMGPVMNLALAVVVMALVLYQGAPGPAFEQQPVVVGRSTDPSAAKAAGVRRAIASSASTATTSTTWEQFSIAVGARRRSAR